MKLKVRIVQVIFVVLFVVLISGCLTDDVLVQVPDIINPVSLSPQVSIGGGEQPRRVGNVEAEVQSDAGMLLFVPMVAGDSSASMKDNVQEQILDVTRGRHDQAVNNVVVDIEHGGICCFAMWFEMQVAKIKGDVLFVE